jgi:hypothetical protein
MDWLGDILGGKKDGLWEQALACCPMAVLK